METMNEFNIVKHCAGPELGRVKRKKNICIEFKNLRLFACQIDRFSTHFSDNFIFYYIFELLLSVFEWLEREKERNERRKNTQRKEE